MLNRELPKPIKRAMRSLCGLAHETELRQALNDLSREFDRWKDVRIDSFELADRIHKFHHGPNREITFVIRAACRCHFSSAEPLTMA